LNVGIIGNPVNEPPGTGWDSGNIPPGCEGVVVLTWDVGNVFDRITLGETFARFRISTDPFASGATGCGFLQESGPTPYCFADDGEVEDHKLEVGQLPASIHAFESAWTENGLEITWGTVSETENVGFYIWGFDGEELHLLTPELIPSEAMDAVTPHQYRFVIADEKVRSMQSLAVTALDIYGTEEIFGMYKVDGAFGRESVAAPIDWASIRAKAESQMELRHAFGSPQLNGSAAIIGADFRVDQAGVYRITYEQLRAAGMDLNGVKPEDLAVTRAGQPIARFVRANGVIGGSRASAAASRNEFGPGSYIEFWGELPSYPDALYVDEYVYRVTVDASSVVNGRTVAQRLVSGSSPDFYFGSFKVNEDNAYNMSSPLNDPWHAARLRSDRASQREYLTDVWVGESFRPGVDGRLEVVVAGGVRFPVSPAHHVRVFFNDVEVRDVKFGPGEIRRIEAEIPAGLIQSGANQVRVFLPGETEAPVDLVYVDTVELFYPREFSMVDGRLLLSDLEPGQRISVSGVPARSRAEVYAWDGDNLINVRTRIRAGAGAVFQTLDEPGLDYWVAPSASMLSPEFVGAVEDVDLLGESADFLVIAHPAFMPLSEFEAHPLNQFVQQREGEGWSIRVVDVTQIQQQYAGGMPLPQAVTEFLRDASNAFSPSHVLLVGGDSYDYRDHLGKGSLSFIPTIYAATSRIPHTPADGLLADLDSDGISDLAIGRWPVRTLGDLQSIVSKTLDWSATVADLQSAIWVADSEDAAQPSFGRQVDRMLGQLSDAGWPEFGLNRILIDEAESVTAARNELFEKIEAGATFTGFVGHGSPASWTFQGLVMPNDLGELWNDGSPTLISTSTCYTSYFVSPFNDTVAHRWMNGFRLDANDQPIPGTPNGAVAIHGASTLSNYAQNEFLVGKTKAHMLEGETLGEAIRRAREEGAGRGLSDQVTNWILLGDPSLQLARDPMMSR
jgi:hypothetical protein